MVGHTGDFQATIKAVEAIDICLGKVIEAAKKVDAEILITSDHGNAEQMRAYATEKIKSDQHTAHTTNLVPLIYIGRDAEIISGRTGTLSDIAPTMLYLMGLEVPQEMTGKPLLKVQ
jgi:2,3-bisphosphoglycerate-independent phosphoglycerate mutase